MHYHWLIVITISTIARLACLATPLASRWDDMHVKHAWEAAPQNWESIGPPFPNTTIDLRIALKPGNEKALVDALYEVSTPSHPKYVFSNTLSTHDVLMRDASVLQIWRIQVTGGDR